MEMTQSVLVHRSKETSHGPVVKHFVGWQGDFYLQLNISKAKDMRILRNIPALMRPQTVILGLLLIQD